MRTLLRIFATLVWLAVASTLILIWQTWRLGDIGALARTGIFGAVTAFGWILTLILGPFAALQLWRLRESGQRASLFLASYTFLYYAGGWFFFEPAGGVTFQLGLTMLWNSLFCGVLLSSPVRRICAAADAPSK